MSYPDDQNLTSLSTLKAWLLPAPTGALAAINVADGGEGYTSVPDVVISDTGQGNGATAVAQVSGGVVTGISITSPGALYLAPSITITGGDGSGATATATVEDDDTIQQLIGDVSQVILNEANISRFYDEGSNVTEVRNGNGRDRMTFIDGPITSVTSVFIIGIGTIPQSNGATFGWLFDAFSIYLIGYCFPKGARNVTIVLRKGESTSLPLTSQRAKNAERAVILTAALWWKRRSVDHLRSQSSPQGMGASSSINTSDIPDAARMIVDNLTQHVYAV